MEYDLNLREQCLNYIGVFQICDSEDELIGYGIGIIQKTQPKYSIITLNEYFTENKTCGKIYFMKPKEIFQDGYCFDIKGKLNDYDGYELNDGSKKMVMEGLVRIYFTKSVTNQRFNTAPQPLERRNMVTYTSICREVGVQQFKINGPTDKIILLVKDINYMERDLSLTAAVLLIEIDEKAYFYGFSRKIQDLINQSYYFTQELTMNQSYNGQHLYIDNVKQKQVLDTIGKIPLHSIGHLLFGDYKGTAFFLQDNDGKTSQYMLTCAHNFTVKVPKQDYLLYRMDNKNQIKVKKFLIEQVHIMDQYWDIKNQKQTYIIFADSPVENIQVPRKKLYDIAVVKLKEKIIIQNCLTFSKQRLFDQKEVQLAGYPRRLQAFSIRQDRLHLSPKCQRNKVLINTQKTIIKHNLSTLSGNSGSPIYQKKQKGLYLLGVHSAGKPTPVESDKPAWKTIWEDIWGQYNVGTYIHSKQVWQFMSKIPGFLQSLKQDYI